MKKIIAFMLCCMMMVGVLNAFAEDGLMPLWECEHENAERDVVDTERDGCTITTITEVTCPDCGYHDYFERTSTSHEWVNEVIDGETVKVCYYCGKIK